MPTDNKPKINKYDKSSRLYVKNIYKKVNGSHNW